MAWVVADRVCETSTSTGTGDMVLGGALTGFQTFANWCNNGDCLYYLIEAVDGSGTPTGDWETGLGIYNTGANSITRTYVSDYGGGAGPVPFATGAKHIHLAVTRESLKTRVARVTMAADLTADFQTSAPVAITWDTRQVDYNNGFWASGSPTLLSWPTVANGVPSDGYVRLSAQVSITNISTTALVQLQLFNGVSGISGAGGYATAYVNSTSVPIVLNVCSGVFRGSGPGDPYSVKLSVSGDTSVTIGHTLSWFQMEHLGTIV